MTDEDQIQLKNDSLRETRKVGKKTEYPKRKIGSLVKAMKGVTTVWEEGQLHTLAAGLGICVPDAPGQGPKTFEDHAAPVRPVERLAGAKKNPKSCRLPLMTCGVDAF
ncbi:MAG: hypothetical protein OXC91_04230 [Rhodobacteraceae bacterium]|nr:hypothetical protein [Paracoccaceae bacterium]